MNNSKETSRRTKICTRLYRSGSTIGQIHQQTGWDRGAIRRYLEKSGVDLQSLCATPHTMPTVNICANERELAYIAGLFDGEGSVNINVSSKQSWLNIDITNTHKEVLDFVKSKVGGPSFYKKDHRKVHQRPVYRWQLVSGKAYLVLMVLLPYLIIKKEQAEIALEFFEWKRDFRGSINDRRTVEIEFKTKLQSFRLANYNRKEYT